MRNAIFIMLLLASMGAIFHLCDHAKGVMGGFLWLAGIAIGAFFRENK